MAERDMINVKDIENWDLEKPIKAGPVKNRRTVVSVSFPSKDFRVVAAAAGDAGLTTSQFIREAAIAKASPVYAEAVVSWAGGSSPFMVSLAPSCFTLAPTPIEYTAEYIPDEADLQDRVTSS